MFASLAFFECSSGERVTENFYFDFNPPEILSMVHEANEHPAARTKTALVRFREQYSRLFAVLRIYKVLLGDEEKSADPFLRPERYVSCWLFAVPPCSVWCCDG